MAARAPKKNTTSMDDLLSLDPKAAEEKPAETFDDLVDTPEADAPAPDTTNVVEDDEDAEIAALKAALAQPLPEEDVVPEETPKQRELRELREQMAQRQSQIADRAAVQHEDIKFGQDTILIHVLTDGFTINGQVTYRGQEFEFPVGGKAYEQTVNREGRTWLNLTEDEQYDRWGEARFGHGPWPFKRLSALTLRDLPEGSTEADLEAVKRAAQRADRRPPIATV